MTELLFAAEYQAPDVPIEAYQNRFGNGGHTGVFAVDEAAALVGASSNSSRTVWCDISKFQGVVTSAYPEPMIAFRVDSGSSTDVHAKANWAYAEKHLQVAIGYCVLIPGDEKSIVKRMKNTLGSRPDAGKFAAMVDMESGTGFAGPGNHSAAGNKLAGLLADWLGSEKRVTAYANHYDYQSCWPQIASWLKPRMVTASYGSSWPGTWAQQYYGALSYPSPSGLPRSMKPFGSNVDLNYAKRSLSQIKTDLGLVVPKPAPKPTPKPAPVIVPQEDDMRVVNVDKTTLPKGVVLPGTGWFLLSDAVGLIRIEYPTGKVNNGLNLMAATGQKPCPITYTQYVTLQKKFGQPL